jgi:arylsulfatase A-like enzyme
VLAGLSLVWVDAQVREGWPFIPTGQHWRWALLLYAGAGALFGALAHGLLVLEAVWSGQRSLLIRSGFFAVAGGALLHGVALSAFTGEAVSATRWAHLGPAMVLMVGAFGCWCAAWLALVAAERLRLGDHAMGLALALGFLIVGLHIARLDLTQYVALYTRLHTALEVGAWTALGVGYGLLLALGRRRYGSVDRVCQVLGSLALASALGLAFSAGLRTGVEGGLRHVFLEEVYVGRMLRRLQLAEAFISDPRGFRSLPLSRLEGLRKRHGLTTLSQDPKWRRAAEPLAPEQQAELWRLRDPLRRYNVIVYYVDTLRGDVASDRQTMPNLAAFAQGALRFPRAYSASSDTLRALPALTGGDYDILSTPKNDVLRLARRAGYESTLVIPQSAQYFLAKLRPEFRFDRTVTIADHPVQQEVWGYGADRATSGLLVDRALELLDEPRRKRQPFFLWLFNFDLHNWRELSNAHVEAAMQRFGITEDPEKLAYRYRAVAAAVDAEFGRFMLELEHRKLLESTVILFVSDHGEALGRDGFWVHSVFLWESLVRVPLLLKAPGLPAREVRQRVSAVDVAPTLARYMTPNPDLSGYAGEDLLQHLLEKPRPRRLPILLVSASKDVRVRVGVIDPVRDYKLVLSLEAALPELYDLNAEDPDSSNVADQHPELTERLLRDLVASPVFPRSLWDFDVRDTKAQRAATGVPVF